MLFKNKEEVLPNKYDLELKELDNIVLSNEAQLRHTIEGLIRVEKIKHSFIVYTDFNRRADEEYDNLLEQFEKIVKNLTVAIKNYNEYLANNINYFVTCKNYFTKPDSGEAIYHMIKKYYLLVEKEGKY